MSDNWFQDILEFHKEFKHHILTYPCIPPDDIKELRKRLIKEEIKETLSAIDNDDMSEIADGIADSIVVLIGTAISYGIYLPDIWDEVHRCNMAKEGGGKDNCGKTLKPKNWHPPEIERLLLEQRWKEICM